MSIRTAASFAGLLLGCALILVGNARCGEYLLLHYLSSSDGPFSTGAAVDQTDDPSEEPTCTQPAAASEQPVLPAVNCLDGDLNKDGKVDGLDIQILVDCLLEQ